MPSAKASVKYDTIVRRNFVITMIMTKIHSIFTGVDFLG